MQKKVSIKTLDKKTIFGVIDTPKGESKGLIIFLHGLTDNFDSHMLPNSAKYFTGKGYSTYRFNFYGEKKQERKLKEASLKTHIQDLNTVIKYFQKGGTQKTFLVGHSFGGLTIVYANIKNISGIILRDASIGGKELLDDVTYNQKTGVYSIDRGDGYKHIIGQKMYKDFCISIEENVQRIKKITVPIKIICAGKSTLKVGGKKYYEEANKPKEFVIVPGASHCFDEEGKEERLFEETYKRVKKYS